ncbi:glucose-6-phosphate exchanger SLC37A2 isoform X2 [Phlebotomus papatasi]|uniref:glucose-6-phosphate exchanger SLC37A2 isoform X2 n=1 Tax=Phlebotomus papatasi TaxID=29031 RepID=UPI00248428E3|nr:glucose-6-phosphate exchanger SLC37A2 isoform X2 [Phlebotomus papatasi]
MRFAWRRWKIIMNTSDVPLGVRCLQFLSTHLCPRLRINRPLCYKFSVLALTYIAYCCYHLTRKPISVVKSVLHRNCSTVALPKGVLLSDAIDNSTWCDYPPFDGPNASALFGTLDSAFLFCYAAAMFASGFIAERVSLRYFLTFGMLFSGIFCYLFGLAKTYSIHSMAYFIFVQAMAGIFQTTGWPGVVTVVGRWFDRSKRGLIFGIWNSHTSIGNILGSLIAANYVESDWSRSFIVPGFIMGVCGFILFLFLVDSPDSVGLTERNMEARRRDQYSRVESNDSPTDDSEPDDTDIVVGEQEVSGNVVRPLRGSINTEVNMRVNERSPMLGSVSSVASNNREAIGFGGALQIPGVVEFSFCLFFSKLVSYTFLYWLPLYIQSSTTLNAELSADLSTVFDVGGIIGAIAAGILSDYTNMPASTCSGMLAVAVPMLLVYQHWGTLSLPVNILLLFVVGILVNGPYALITTSVSAELGQHSCLQGNAKAVATVTAIIDGTGSIGAAVGPLLAGLVSTSGWENVFYMLMISDVLALLLLVRLATKEFKRRKRNVRIE